MAKQRIINHHPPKQLQLSEASQSNQILLEKRKKKKRRRRNARGQKARLNRNTRGIFPAREARGK